MMSVEPGGDREFEGFLAEVSTRFTGIPGAEVDAEIERTLRELCELLDTDRATVAEFTGEGESLRPTHSWARPPLRPFRTSLIRTEIPWLYHQLLRGQTVRLERLPDEVPAEAAQDRASMRRAGMRSVLAIPIAVGGRFVCALSTGAFRTHRAWSDATVARVRTVGQILANGLYRRQAEAELGARLAAIEELKARLEAENVYLRAEATPTHGFHQVVGRSVVMRAVLDRAVAVASTPTSVLLLGETGTGKEILAEAIHRQSTRRNRMLVKVNCAALPPTLIESELFGHEKGAFTGATVVRAGRFELADGGTLLLDEIGDLPLELQSKLLRVLQEGEFERVGGTRTHKVDVRVIAATNRDLPRALAEGRFRADLYYRLSVFPILLPPLRERRDDIPLLVWAMIERLQPRLGRLITRVPKPVMDRLVSYGWPGNVRELENIVERALILSPGHVLQVEETLDGAGPRRTERLEDVERDHIVHVLERCDWRVNGAGNAAAILGLNPSTLRSRIQKLGITRPAGRAGLRR
jgi:transcriptional regulator with GAF, ATPase, and Fis domain